MAHPIPARLSGPYTAAAGRKFGFTVGIAFLVLAGIGRWRGHAVSSVVFAAVGAALLGGALLVPAMLGPIDRGWMALAGAISKVTTPIFMGIVYFVIITPVGLLRRVFGGSALVHRLGKHGYWADRSQTPRSSLDRQF